MSRPWIRIALGVILCGTTALATAMTQLPPPEGPDFRPLRPPVLGYVVEHDAASSRYRLVAVGDDRVLAEGDLDVCQDKLVEQLEAAWGTGHPNLAIPTPGGLQFWADVFWFAGWRIQENVYTGHCRLLDPGNVRRAWGSREACRTAFEGLRRTEGLVMEDEHLVVLLHGLGRTRESLSRLKWELRDAGYMTASITYPSTRRTLVEHTEQLTQVLERLEGVSTVSFVTHSLGGLVVRAVLARRGRWRDRIAVGRLVMLAPPSHGSALAEEVTEYMPARKLLGPVADELSLDEFEEIPAPDCEFGIIAAGGPGETGWNPLLDGDDDGVVSVEETKLEGAADFLLVRGLHTFLMNDPEVIRASVRFLATGAFGEDGGRADPGRGGDGGADADDG